MLAILAHAHPQTPAPWEIEPNTNSGLFSILRLASGVEVVQGDLDALRHGLLTLTDPDTGVVVLLVGLVIAVGVALCTCQTLQKSHSYQVQLTT